MVIYEMAQLMEKGGAENGSMFISFWGSNSNYKGLVVLRVEQIQ